MVAITEHKKHYKTLNINVFNGGLENSLLDPINDLVTQFSGKPGLVAEPFRSGGSCLLIQRPE